LSKRRRPYLDAVDLEILLRIPATATALLDAGAGDGRRALHIVVQSGLRQTVLVEPSSGMRALIPPGCEVWDAKIEALPDTSRQFDVVLCLWNVLGHVLNGALRVAALKNLARLCSSRGLIFLDVLHRYNVAECGASTVLQRLFRDMLFPADHNGDVPVRWQAGGHEVQARGHVFTIGEMAGLFRQADLTVEERIVLDYRTGQHRRWPAFGNLLYVLRPEIR
jgi:hypothetical protein